MKLHDIPEISTEEHHLCAIETLAMCYAFVPWDLKDAIYELTRTAHKMGADIDANDLDVDLKSLLLQTYRGKAISKRMDAELDRIREITKKYSQSLYPTKGETLSQYLS